MRFRFRSLLLLVLAGLLGGCAMPGSPQAGAATSTDADVWVFMSAGLYAREGHEQYGEGEGRYMSELDAQMLGFREAGSR